MKNVYNIFKTFGNIFFRDKVNIFMIFFFNAFLMVIFGLTINDQYNIPINIGIVDCVNTTVTQQTVQHLRDQPNIKITSFVSEDSLMNEVKLGKLVVGVILNSDQNHKKINVSLIGDSTRIMWLDFLNPVLKASLIGEDSSNEKVSMKTELIKSSNINYFDFIFPGLLIFSVMQIGLSGGVMLLVQRKNENLKRLQITPLKKWEFLLGYILCYLCIMILQVIFYILIAYYLFDYKFVGYYSQIISMILFASIFFIALGILLCNFSNTIENGNNFNRFFIFPAGFLCGVFIPLSTLPEIVQKVALIHPLTYFVKIMRDVSNYNKHISDSPLKYGILLGVFIIIVFSAVYSFRWQQETA